MRRISRFAIFLAFITIFVVPAVVGAAHLSLTPFVGTWHSADPSKGGIVTIIIRDEGGIQIRVISACSSDLCDWGAVKGTAYGRSESAVRANAFIAVYGTNYSESVMTGSRVGANLRLEIFTKLRDGSGQSDHTSTGVFIRE